MLKDFEGNSLGGVLPELVRRVKIELRVISMAEVHFPGEFHAAHTHLGEYSVGVYYAQVTQPLKAFPSQ